MTDRDASTGRRRAWWLAGVGALVAVAGAGWFVGQRVRSPEQAASEAAAPEASWITAPVEHRVLSQTLISRGDVRPSTAVSVGVPASVEGTAVVTAVGARPGEAVVEGMRLVEVSGRPVFLLQGEVPVYRTLRPGMSGADVEQLQAALARLGCDATGEAGAFGDATKWCVASLYLDAGYEPVPTSATEATELTAAEQAVLDAEAAVDSAELSLSTARRGASETAVLAAQQALDAARRGYADATADAQSGVADAEAVLAAAQATHAQLAGDPAASPAEVNAAAAEVGVATRSLDNARRAGESMLAAAADAVALAEAGLAEVREAPDVAAEQAGVAQAQAARDRAQQALDQLRATTGPTVPQGEVVFAPTLPARVQTGAGELGAVGEGESNGAAGEGSSGGQGGELMVLSAGDLVVSMTLRADQVGLARAGMPVELLDEQTNTTHPATITEIAESATTGADGQLGHAVTIAADEPLPETLVGANLRVTITAASTETATLVVPLAAVSSGADGSTNVSLLRNGEPVVVPVVAGLSADGFVSIEPQQEGSIAEGDAVITGR